VLAISPHAVAEATDRVVVRGVGAVRIGVFGVGVGQRGPEHVLDARVERGDLGGVPAPAEAQPPQGRRAAPALPQPLLVAPARVAREVAREHQHGADRGASEPGDLARCEQAASEQRDGR
jgi:hypothetical protein